LRARRRCRRGRRDLLLRPWRAVLEGIASVVR
jgi:hypothetical protein